MAAAPLCFSFTEAVFSLRAGELIVMRRPRGIALVWFGPCDLWVSQGVTDYIVPRAAPWHVQDGVDAYIQPLAAGELVITRLPVARSRLAALADALLRDTGAIFLTSAR